jgi:hypothetical protein
VPGIILLSCIRAFQTAESLSKLILPVLHFSSGLFFKIQKDTDLLKNKNMKQVAQSVAKHWHSKQKENIS